MEKGELVSLLGPSGCGKTTTLRLIAGFLDGKEGKIIFDNNDYTSVPVHKRNFGFVFQNYALFPHLNVFNNIAFGLNFRNFSKSEIKKKVMDMLDVVDLVGYENRFPSEMSGGQRQRVALARALVIEPDLLLLDEPLSNLDAKLRITMRMEIRKIQQKLGITTIYVTHDQEECFAISDKVAIMNDGVIEQMDDPSEIYNYPANEFVANFVGFENFIDLKLISKEDDLWKLQTTNGINFSVKYLDLYKYLTPTKGVIRPDDIEIIKDKLKTENSVSGEILVRTYLGRNNQYQVKTDLGNFVVNDESVEFFESGDNVSLVFPEDKIILVEII